MAPNMNSFSFAMQNKKIYILKKKKKKAKKRQLLAQFI